MRHLIRFVVATAACILLTPAVAYAAPTPSAPPAADPAPKAWILVDGDSGAVLAASNPHTPLLVASTVKVMTAITAIELLPPNAALKVSANAAAREPMKIDMREGEVWPLNETLQSLLMVSANDAAYVLAENAGGSLSGFAREMQTTGKRLGMRDSTFADPAGLDDGNSYGGGSRMSAYDLAIAGRNLLAVPELADIVKTRRATFVDPRGSQRSLPNHNRLLSRYEGASGVKTGFTKQSGRTLVASASRNGRSMIAVVLDYPDDYAFAGQILDRGFSTPRGAQGTGERIPEPRIVTASRVGKGAPLEAPTSPNATDATNATNTADSTRADQAGADIPWIPIAAGVGVICGIVVWQRARVRRRRRARLARQRRIETARRRNALTAMGLDDRRRVGRRP